MDGRDSNTVERLLEGGHCSLEDIQEAQGIRDKMLEMGLRPRSLVDVLHDKGTIDDETFKTIQREARRFMGQEQIAGYRLLEQLGEGSMGSVYKARQLSLDRDVAVKVLAADLVADEGAVERFMVEARAVARLNHTNIISGIDVGDAGGIKYLVMEYADGMTVDTLLNRGGAMDEERALMIAQQMARALDHAHRNDLIHRDVKPANMILTKDGVAKLCDLGLARLDAGPGEDTTRMGTAAYMSPEQARGAGRVDERTDVYSLGATLFHMLTGRPPFEGADAQAVIMGHLAEKPTPPNVLRPDVSPETSMFVLQLLAKQPGDRVQTARELVDLCGARLRELQAARGVQPGGSSRAVAARPSTPAAAAPTKLSTEVGPVVKRRKRRRR